MADELTSTNSGKGAALWIAIIALILAIAAVVAIIVYLIAYAITGGTPGPKVTGCKYNVVIGVPSEGTDSFYAVGCACYQTAAVSNINLTITGQSSPQGDYFMIDASSASSTVTLVGINVIGGNVVYPGTVTVWYWRDSNTIVRVSTSPGTGAVPSEKKTTFPVVGPQCGWVCPKKVDPNIHQSCYVPYGV